MKNNKKIIGLSLVIIMIALLFFFFQKLQDNNTNSSKGNSTISSGDLKDKEANKDDVKASPGNTEDVSDKSGDSETSSEDKNKGNDKATDDSIKDQGITVFVTAANFGSTADIVIDSSKFNKDCKFYQFYSENKPVSKLESITILQTTIFPAQEAGSEVILGLFDGSQKEIKKLSIKLIEKK